MLGAGDGAEPAVEPELHAAAASRRAPNDTVRKVSRVTLVGDRRIRDRG